MRHPVLEYEVLLRDGARLSVTCHVIIDRSDVVLFAWLGRPAESAVALSVPVDAIWQVSLLAVWNDLAPLDSDRGGLRRPA